MGRCPAWLRCGAKLFFACVRVETGEFSLQQTKATAQRFSSCKVAVSLPTGSAARSVRYQGAFNTFFTSDTELVVAWQEPSNDGFCAVR